MDKLSHSVTWPSRAFHGQSNRCPPNAARAHVQNGKSVDFCADFATTICLLLGLPPPFASLGYFVPDLVPKNLGVEGGFADTGMCGGSVSGSYALYGARISSSQIDTYIRRYSRVSPSFPPDSFDRIMKLLAAAGTLV